jgi:DNA-binding CsgD family transcriptional regulator
MGWNHEETELLKSLAGKVPTDDIARQLNRTYSSVIHKASSLKVSLLIPVSWTNEELDVLRELAGTCTAKQIGEQIGKNANAVRVQASKIKISLKRPFWTDDELMQLELWAGELPPEVIAHRLNKKVPTVRQQAYRMGLSLRLEVDYFDIKTLSELIGVGRFVITKWVQDGKLSAYRTSISKKSIHRITRRQFTNFYRKYKNHIPALQSIDPERLEYVLNEKN